MGPAAAVADPLLLRGGWAPRRVLGAASTMSLALPAAQPSRSQLYAPRGVLLDPVGDRVRVVAADTGNHRLLVWDDVPDADGADCAVVLGQPDPTSEGPQAGGRGPERGLHLPTGLARAGDLLLVADGWNHRVLAYDAALDTDDAAPVGVLGQDGLSAVEANRGGDVDGSGLYWPFGLLWHEGWLWVADTGNRRVLGWRGLPGLDGSPQRPADVVLGQPSAATRDENRGGDVAADSFRWPHALGVLRGDLWVADAGNHRLLGWRGVPDGDRPADVVLGQAAFTTAREQPHVPQSGGRLRFPYSLAVCGDGLAVADTANNRVLWWPDGPRPDAAGVCGPAPCVLGQDDLDAAGENRWTAVLPDTFCWPYGLSAAGGLLAVADSGNNRVSLWGRG